MTITNPQLLNTLTGALQKATDMEVKLCEVYTDPEPNHTDHLLLQTAISTLAKCTHMISTLFPTPPETP